MSDWRKATVALRRGEKWQVKPQCEAMDGMAVHVRPGWYIEAEDSSIYVGERAMLFREHGLPISWIAEGDLRFPGPTPPAPHNPE